jgi:predicted transcriptional regulator
MIYVLNLSQEYDTKNKLNVIISCLKANHGSSDRTSLLRKSRLDKKEFDSAISTLIESKEIIEVHKKNPAAKIATKIYCLNPD